MGRLSIKGRLIAVLIIFITVFTSFGGFALVKIRELEGVTKSIYADPLKVSSAAIEARVDMLKLKSLMRDILILSDEEMVRAAAQEHAVLESRIYENLDEIKNNAVREESKDLEKQVREEYFRWMKDHEIILHDLQFDSQKVIDLNYGSNEMLVQSMEDKLINIDILAKQRAAQLVEQANDLQKELELLLMVLNIGVVLILTILFTFVIRSIITSINKLQHAMNESAATGILRDAEFEGDHEISDIAKRYNALLQKLRNQFWLKDGQNSLNHEISTAANLKEMTQKSLNFIVKNLGIGKAALYLYNDSTKSLELNCSYAYTEKEQRFGVYALGEGIVGQAGLDKKPISLDNIRDYEGYISTGVTLEATISIYTFPLIFENSLYGVIELASFEPFDELKREFLKEAGTIIAANVNSEMQSQKVKTLLEISEKSQMEARYNASQLIITNQMLEEQQLRLQQQSEELQQTNAELEEQQQLLQQQSEELQQTNAELEEHQMLMEEQAKLLNMRNLQLEASRQDLIKHSMELEAANKYKSQFLANMSHELRTPLNSIILLSKLLLKSEKKELDKQQRDKLEIINGSGQELLRLINDILDLSKIESGKMNVSIEEFHTKDLLDGIKKMFDNEAKEKKIKLLCIDKVNTQIYGDYNKIAQILRNLMSNSIKFTAHGKVSLEIKAFNDRDIHMTVTDTGIGISEENLKRIFEEFQQGDGSISRKYGGTGLGLSISQKLAWVMNGEILVESEEGKGSSFTLHLKDILAVKESKIQEIEMIQANSDKMMLEAAVLSEDKAVKAAKRLLIVDDNELHCLAVKELLQSADIEIDTVETEAAAKQKLEEAAYDIVILDLELESGSGTSICRFMYEKQYGTPIIVYTGKELTIEQEREIKRYADSIIIKTANSGDRLLDEVALFLYKVKKNNLKAQYLVSKTNIQYALTLENKKILIADDDPRNIFVLASALENFGAEIVEAENGKVALEMLEKHKIDLVLMDIMMPVMDGYQAIKAIRDNKTFGNTPIIAVTAKSLMDDREKCIAAGANDYISKPIDYDVLVRLVKAWISKQ